MVPPGDVADTAEPPPDPGPSTNEDPGVELDVALDSATEPPEASEPSDGEETTEPEETTAPPDTTEPADLTEPEEVTEPEDTTQPNDSSGPDEPSEPLDATDATDASDPEDIPPEDEGAPIDSTEPVDPGKPPDPGPADDGPPPDDGPEVSPDIVEPPCLVDGDCADGDPCTLDSCDDVAGCQQELIPDCCTEDADCPTGALAACEVAKCQKETNKCVATLAPAGSPCDDGEACTDGESCAGAVCGGGALVCECLADVDCPDDGNLCNGLPTCVANLCEVTAVVVCDPESPPCDIATCDPSTGKCASAPALDCDDGNPCTTDSCAISVGCVYGLAAGPCDDGEPCTAEDLCVSGGCVGTDIECDDGQPCTTDSCDAGECVFVKEGCDAECDCEGCVGGLLVGACDDGDPATVGDVCLYGVCKGLALTDAMPAGAAEDPWLDRLGSVDGAVYATGGDSSGAAGDTDGKLRGWLGAVNDAAGEASVTVVPESTVDGDAWVGVSSGLAVTTSGAQLVWKDGAWTTTPLAGADTLPADVRALWRGATLGGTLTFLAGRAADVSYVAVCPEPEACVVQTVGYADFAKSEIPRALGGAATGDGTPLADMVLVADFPQGPSHFNDAFEVAWASPSQQWQLGYFDQSASASSTADVFVTSAKAAWWVGSAGLLRARDPTSGDWKPLTSLFTDQDELHMNGVWADGAVVVISAVRTTATSRVLTLLVHNAKAAVTDEWAEIPLLTLPSAPACAATYCPSPSAGSLEDVWISATKTLVTVGWKWEEGALKAILATR